VVAIIGCGKKYFNHNYSWLRYANEITYPFYIIHQVIIGIVGFYIIRWIPGVEIEFFIICVVSFLFTLSVCELIKLTNLTRFILGMKLIPKLKKDQKQKSKPNSDELNP
jgi:peptidoglycan/LPS O-acetylase OafA/YrhL